MDQEKYRLPRNVVPANYEIIIQVDFKTYTFQGDCRIQTRISEDTNVIKLNCVDLEFCENDVFYENQGLVLKCNRVEFCREFDTASVFLEDVLKATGLGRLHIKYKGVLDDKMVGFYRVKYRYPVPEGHEQYTAVTQFEACDARKAFPCWDEPAFKATFDIAIVTDPVYTVLSNMPVKETIDAGSSLKKIAFETTPIMSTYLVAFVIGHYARLKSVHFKNTCITVYTPIDKENLGEFALDFARNSLEFYSDYFKIDYPLPKMDLIAVPENPIEAMENFGLIIFNETNMLLDKKNSSIETTITNAYIVAHEIAHQW
jgi:aminopeptidase N